MFYGLLKILKSVGERFIVLVVDLYFWVMQILITSFWGPELLDPYHTNQGAFISSQIRGQRTG